MRQGGHTSPELFKVYINDLIQELISTRMLCYLRDASQILDRISTVVKDHVTAAHLVDGEVVLRVGRGGALLLHQPQVGEREVLLRAVLRLVRAAVS